jgi:ribonuclease D
VTIHLHQGDLPAGIDFGASVAIDTETMGLNPLRDRLCQYNAPNLRALLADPKVLKIFHFGRFDIAVMAHYLGVVAAPVYCTKIASKLARTFTDKHGLKDLCRELLNVDLSKQQQSSDWGAAALTEEQKRYAASDVLHLHALKAKLDAMLMRENRQQLALACFAFLPTRAFLDLTGYENADIFEH